MKHLLILCLLFVCTAPTVAQPTVHRASPTDPIQVCVPYSMGWNIASNPVVRAPGTDSIWQVFCGHGSCFFRGSFIQCTAPNGIGLWIKVTGYPTLCCIDGEAIAQDSIHVVTGWNLIGTISSPVAVSSIISVPPNIMISRCFGYSSHYVDADTLRPGFGYWVKVNQSGSLVLASGL